MEEPFGLPISRRKIVATVGLGLGAMPLARAGAASGSGTSGSAAGAGAGAVGTGTSGVVNGAVPAQAIGRPLPSAVKLNEPCSRRLGIAVVGLGNFALAEIMPRIAKTRHVRLAAVVSGNRGKANAMAMSYGLSEKSVYGYDNFDRLKDDPSVDAVYIILPPALHAEYTVRAARLGKHVLCEKPMAPNSAECRKMIDACRHAGRRLMIAYRVHWEPHNVETVKLLRSGRIGTVRQINGEHGTPADPSTPHSEWRIQRSLNGGGSLWDVGIYSLNAARLFSGEEPVEVRAAFRRPPGSTIGRRTADVERGVAWEARFPSGLIAIGTSAYEYSANRIGVHGDKGTIELSPATSYVGDQLYIKTKTGELKPKLGESEDQFIGMMDEFALAVRENRDPRTGGEEALQDVRIMELIYEAARIGRPVPVPMSDSSAK